MATKFAKEAKKLIAEEELIFKETRAEIQLIGEMIDDQIKTLIKLKKYLQINLRGGMFSRDKNDQVDNRKNRISNIRVRIEQLLEEF